VRVASPVSEAIVNRRRSGLGLGLLQELPLRQGFGPRTMQGLSFPNDSAIRVRSIRCNCHDGHVCIRVKERVVYFRVCIRLRSWVCVRLSSRSVAFRSCRGRVVSRSRTTLVAQSHQCPLSYQSSKNIAECKKATWIYNNKHYNVYLYTLHLS